MFCIPESFILIRAGLSPSPSIMTRQKQTSQKHIPLVKTTKATIKGPKPAIAGIKKLHHFHPRTVALHKI
ncbi:hypothetical protein BC936DRAFT_140554 [Jimgerdemannia flammicorona]|uniref:Uncharacterized protein n=1 Tax=Jimgerdemannia flammicorona TaxID=994334 RepID=A0A433DGY6_9FUNG|nr:hypothetical protein BC936DRAFT_140554 [Jimgerdemannia flammicorona]